MKREEKQLYRKNFTLVIIFLILISVSLIVALGLAYSLTSRYVENEFNTKKIDVLEETVKPYNDLFQNKIPEVSFYQGYLDSASAAKYVKGLTAKFPFIDKVVFYDTEISNHMISDGFRVYNFSLGPKAVYQYGAKVPKDSVVLFKSSNPNGLSLRTADEFNKMAVKFTSYIESADTSRAISSDEIFNTFYSITSKRISYMNIPQRNEMRIFKDMMFKKQPSSPIFEQDMLTFYLDPSKLMINNSHDQLYQSISIRPLVYESLDNDNKSRVTTDIPLPGAFSDYKLYFSSSRSFLTMEINRRFWPIAGILLLIYGVLASIAYLIYRNLNINSRMFKLQYDFINNLTHEFKTPVSVIKIAGNNIRSAAELSDRERMHYGKILDEEADKLNDLMNKLLSFTQIENKAIKIKHENINLEIFCQNLIDAYHIKYPNFEINYDISAPEYFKSDPVLLSSIFQNLIDNAYKYSQPDKKVLDISIKKVKRNLVFKFKDQGI